MGLLGGCLPWWVFARRVSCDCSGAAWSSERLALALAPVCWRSCGGSLPWWEFAPARACLGVACPGGCPAIAMALLGLASALRLPWHLSAWRSCGGSFPWRVLASEGVFSAGACLGVACPDGCPALALAPVCLAELWREFAPVGCLGSAPRLPWRRLVWRVSYDCHGAAWSGGCPAIAMALLGLASALRLPWRLSAWRSCEVLACDSDLVRQGRGLPYKTGSVKDWFGKTRFSRTNWIRRRISLAQ